MSEPAKAWGGNVPLGKESIMLTKSKVEVQVTNADQTKFLDVNFDDKNSKVTLTIGAAGEDGHSGTITLASCTVGDIFEKIKDFQARYINIDDRRVTTQVLQAVQETQEGCPL